MKVFLEATKERPSEKAGPSMGLKKTQTKLWMEEGKSPTAAPGPPRWLPRASQEMYRTKGKRSPGQNENGRVRVVVVWSGRWGVSIVVVTAGLHSPGKVPLSFLSASFENKLRGTTARRKPHCTGVWSGGALLGFSDNERGGKERRRVHRRSMCGPVLKVKRKGVEKNVEGRSSVQEGGGKGDDVVSRWERKNF